MLSAIRPEASCATTPESTCEMALNEASPGGQFATTSRLLHFHRLGRKKAQRQLSNLQRPMMSAPQPAARAIVACSRARIARPPPEDHTRSQEYSLRVDF